MNEITPTQLKRLGIKPPPKCGCEKENYKLEKLKGESGLWISAHCMSCRAQFLFHNRWFRPSPTDVVI